MAEATCAHIEAITNIKRVKRRECDECVKISARWVHLRTCQECGTTLVATTRQTATPPSTRGRANIR